MTDNHRHVAGRYGYAEVTPTAAERARGYDRAFQVLNLTVLEDDGWFETVGDVVCSREAAVSQARELARYEKSGGDRLNRQAIREWAAKLTA